jgi:hypothetical protein
MKKGMLRLGASVGRSSVRKFDVHRVLALKTNQDFQINTHISLKNEYVFFQVSKVASSTVVHHLQSVEFEGSGFKVQNPNNKHVSPHLSPFQLPEKELLEVMESERYRKIAFVRNPFSRLLSCYLHRIVGAPESPSARLFARVSGGTSVPSFEEFIKVVCDQRSRDMDRHWRVQSDEVLADVVGLDFVGKFENLNNDLCSLEQYLFGRKAFDRSTLKEFNASPASTGSDGRVQGYYDVDLVKRVVERFERDFELFGYEPRIE